MGPRLRNQRMWFHTRALSLGPLAQTKAWPIQWMGEAGTSHAWEKSRFLKMPDALTRTKEKDKEKTTVKKLPLFLAFAKSKK